VRRRNWLNAAAAAVLGAALQSIVTALQSGETDWKKIGKSAAIGALIGFTGWAFPTYRKQATSEQTQ